MLDKFELMRQLSGAGISVPRTECLDLMSGHPSTYPCIVKPRRGRGVRIVNNAEEAVALQRFLVEQFVLQDRMRGTEFTVLMAANEERELAAVVPVEAEARNND